MPGAMAHAHVTGPTDEGAPDQATGASDGLFVNNGAQRPGAATKRAT